MQVRPFIGAIAVSAAMAGSALAQSAPMNASAATPTPTPVTVPHITGATPGECVKGGSSWYSATLTALPTTERNARRAELYADQKNMVKECGASFSIDKSKPADLAGLTDYYTFVGDTMNARMSLDRALLAKGLPDRVHGTVLLQAMTREYARATGVFGILPEAEKYAAQVDALPDSMIDLKISAHQSLMHRYDYLDVADGLKTHAEALIAMGRKTHNNNVLIDAFSSLARSNADKLHPDVALKILDDAEKELGIAVVADRFKDFRDRYALIGTQAPAVTGKWWVNSNGATDAVTPGNGKVTLVEFSAHWCAPCKNSYPGLIEVNKHFAGQPFQGVIATGVYGYIGTRRPLTPEQEVAADDEYFGKEHGLPFRVAINVDAPKVLPTDYGPLLDRSYRVGGIPQIMIIDKKGVIRQIVTGWDQGNTARFTAYIESLMAEK